MANLSGITPLIINGLRHAYQYRVQVVGLKGNVPLEDVINEALDRINNAQDLDEQNLSFDLDTTNPNLPILNLTISNGNTINIPIPIPSSQSVVCVNDFISLPNPGAADTLYILKDDGNGYPQTMYWDGTNYQHADTEYFQVVPVTAPPTVTTPNAFYYNATTGEWWLTDGQGTLFPLSWHCNTGFQNGSVIYQDDQCLGEDNPNLFYDDGIKSLNVGSNTPNAKVQIVGTNPAPNKAFGSPMQHVGLNVDVTGNPNPLHKAILVQADFGNGSDNTQLVQVNRNGQTTGALATTLNKGIRWIYPGGWVYHHSGFEVSLYGNHLRDLNNAGYKFIGCKVVRDNGAFNVNDRFHAQARGLAFYSNLRLASILNGALVVGKDGPPANGVILTASNGTVEFERYGANNVTGTMTTVTAFDANGNVIEVLPGSIPSDKSIKTNEREININIDNLIPKAYEKTIPVNKEFIQINEDEIKAWEALPEEEKEGQEPPQPEYEERIEYGKVTEYGFIAEELEDEIPHAVTETGDIKSILYYQLIPVLTKELQEAKSTIADLVKRVEKLEKKNSKK